MVPERRGCRYEFFAMSSFASAICDVEPRDNGSYSITGSPWLGASLRRMLRGITLSNTIEPKCPLSSSYIWLARRRRASYIVRRKPSISREGFRRDFMMRMVLSSLVMPSSANYSAWTGIITESAAVRALTVISPSDGEQSMSM